MPNYAQLIKDLQRVVGPNGVVSDPSALKTYDADGLVAHPHAPDVVVLPTTTEQVVEVVKLARRANVPIVARGTGTGLSGGATPARGGVIVTTARMDKILEVDVRNSRVRVQPGVINFELSQYLKSYGYQFAADPSSQKACTIGGNIANNSGGPHCIKYGVTGSHVLGVKIVLPDGAVMWTGDGTPDVPGYDLTGVVVGSEGTTCIVTEAWLKMTKLAEATRVVLAFYPDVANVAQTVSDVIAGGFLPAALEAMDANALKAVDDAYHIGLPPGTAGALIIEVDGVDDGLDATLAEIVDICTKNQAFEVRPAKTAEEQTKVWAARKNAFGAMGRLARNYYLVDTVVPRTRLPFMMEQVKRISREVGLPIANVFHAGDGNLHPIVLYDRTRPGEYDRAHAAAAEVMRLSIEQGGVISGEHGIGMEKQEYMPMLFTDGDLAAMAAVHQCFDPDDALNPGKVFPTSCDAAALAAMRRRSARPTMGEADLERVVKQQRERVWI